MNKLNIVIWRENWCASENGNFHQTVCFSFPWKFVKWKQVTVTNKILQRSEVLCEFESFRNSDFFSIFYELPVTRAWTSSISFCFSSASKLLYHLASRVLPARFWIKINFIGILILLFWEAHIYLHTGKWNSSF